MPAWPLIILLFVFKSQLSPNPLANWNIPRLKRRLTTFVLKKMKQMEFIQASKLDLMCPFGNWSECTQFSRVTD